MTTLPSQNTLKKWRCSYKNVSHVPYSLSPLTSSLFFSFASLSTSPERVLVWPLLVVLARKFPLNEWAHIKLRHFHSEHEFSIIIKTEKAHRLRLAIMYERSLLSRSRSLFRCVHVNYTTPFVRAANNYFRTHILTFAHAAFLTSLTSPSSSSSWLLLLKICLRLGKKIIQPFDRTKVNGKRASSHCLLVLNFCFQNEPTNETREKSGSYHWWNWNFGAVRWYTFRFTFIWGSLYVKATISNPRRIHLLHSVFFGNNFFSSKWTFFWSWLTVTANVLKIFCYRRMFFFLHNVVIHFFNNYVNIFYNSTKYSMEYMEIWRVRILRSALSREAKKSMTDCQRFVISFIWNISLENLTTCRESARLFKTICSSGCAAGNTKKVLEFLNKFSRNGNDDKNKNAHWGFFVHHEPSYYHSNFPLKYKIY